MLSELVVYILFHMYSTFFVNSLKSGTLCVYDIISDILFHMYSTNFVKFL
jgi:hypothetical protein